MTEKLSDAQLNELEQSLDELEQSITELLSNTEVGAAPVKLKDNVGRLSRMDEMHNQSILKANRTVLTNRLKGVKEAKLRFSGEDYGLCLECDEVIKFPRLKAYPDAAMCITCQTKAEQE